MHRRSLAVGDADQIADFHLAKPKGNITTADLAADLHNAGGLADAAVPDHAGSEIGPGQDLLQDQFHLFDVHVNP